MLIVGTEFTSADFNVDNHLLDELKVIAKNVLEFVRNRYINYEPVKRPAIKYNNKRRPINFRSKMTLSTRRYRLITINRQERERIVKKKSWTLQYLIRILGKYHSYVYCKRCRESFELGESVKTGMHKHSLIGKPCRICGEIVGPNYNVIYKKRWVPEHEKGPKDGITVKLGRHIVSNRLNN